MKDGWIRSISPTRRSGYNPVYRIYRASNPQPGYFVIRFTDAATSSGT
jgi:hypothetical protein